MRYVSCAGGNRPFFDDARLALEKHFSVKDGNWYALGQAIVLLTA